MTDSDLSLMQDLQRGNDAALDELMQRHQEPLYRFIYRYLLNEEEARDVLQETFVRVYFKRHQYRPTAKYTTWLYQIALNLCRDYSRSHAGKQHGLTDSIFTFSKEGEGKERELHGNTANPAEMAQTHEALTAVDRAIQTLSHELRSVLILVTLEQRSHKECAELLAITPKAVETRLSRARKILETKLIDLRD